MYKVVEKVCCENGYCKSFISGNTRIDFKILNKLDEIWNSEMNKVSNFLLNLLQPFKSDRLFWVFNFILIFKIRNCVFIFNSADVLNSWLSRVSISMLIWKTPAQNFTDKKFLKICIKGWILRIDKSFLYQKYCSDHS